MIDPTTRSRLALVDGNRAYAVFLAARNRYFVRFSKRRSVTAWSLAGAKLFVCEADAKYVRLILTARGIAAVVVNVQATA